jgi:hypothetical protein
MSIKKLSAMCLSRCLAGMLIATAATTAFAQAGDPNAPFATGNSASRPAPLRPLIAPPVILPPLSVEDVGGELIARLLTVPGVRTVVPLPDTPNVLRLMAHNDMSIRLDTLVTRLNAEGADRDGEYLRFETNVRSFLARTDPFKPEQLRVVIRTTAAIDAFEALSAAGGVPNLVVRRPFAENMEEVVVGDTPTTIAFMPAARLSDLSLSADQAFELGRTNTVTVSAEVNWQTKNGLLEGGSGTGYETSLLALDSVWTNMAQRLGGPVAVIVPTRDKIVVGRADQPRDITRLREMVTAQAKGDLALSDKIWVRDGTIWVAR